MSLDLHEIENQVAQVAQELITEMEADLSLGDIFVLGCSTSEVCGVHIGKGSNPEVGQTIVTALLEVTKKYSLHLAVQGCEHINRALAVEKAVAQQNGFEIVSVVPAMHAGGACSVAAFEKFNDPVEVEHILAKLGIDIGDTSIGMHVKHVQVPFRPTIKTIGYAHVTALKSRPKLIGGARAQYQ